MRSKNIYLIINPRAGQDMTRITDVITVLSAAGWNVDNALVEYGGHAIKLAAKAAKKGYDVIVAHGGDGTINEVVNAVLSGKERQSVVGVLPGGTANQWAHEIGVPIDPVRSALALVNSDIRNVDVGHIQVEQITFPDTTQSDQAQPSQKKGEQSKKVKEKDGKGTHYFLLTAGLGIDAAIISHTSKSLKERIGRLAFDVAATKELPEQHPFSIEIREVGADDRNEQEKKILWQGEALQIVLGNTRLYADVVELTPDAYIDDGLLDVCAIKADSPGNTVRQITSLLTRRKPDNTSTEYVRSAHMILTLPASVELQLDGSSVELHDYLSDAEREALQHAEDLTKVLVTYRIDVMPQALRVAIPRTYDNTLFEHAPKMETSQDHTEQNVVHIDSRGSEETQPRDAQQQARIDDLLTHGQRVTVVATAPNPERHNTYIVAGNAHKKSTDDVKPVAVCIDDNTQILQHDGARVEASIVEKLKEGAVMVVEGKENKRGVIQATHMVMEEAIQQ